MGFDRSKPWANFTLCASGACAVLVALVAALGCARSHEQALLYDLVEEYSVAEVLRETPVIDIGTEAGRAHLRDGWSWDEDRKDGTTFAWATGEGSEVEFFLTEPRALHLTLRCFPFTFPDSPRQKVDVLVNGTWIQSFDLERGDHDYALELPEEPLHGGINRMQFRYAYNRPVCEVRPSNDQRALAVGWESIRFEDVGLPGDFAVVGESRAFFLPFGSEVGFYLGLPEGCRLVMDAVEGPAVDGWRLEIWRQTDGEPRRLLDTLVTPDSRVEIPLPQLSSHPVRLSLRACGGDRGEAAGLTVTAPAVYRSAEQPPARVGEEDADSLDARTGGRPPNVLIYLVDTLRADRLGCYGHPVPVSPNIDAFASEAIVFDRVVAQTSWTKPSVVTALTGLGPLVHGVNGRMDPLPEALTTLGEMLHDRGYATAGFAANAYITEKAGFAQGFDDFDFAHSRSGEVTKKVLEWLDKYQKQTPFFLYVHTIDPHAPYEPIEPYRSRFAASVTDRSIGTHDHIRGIARKEIAVTDDLVRQMLALYDAEIAENDHSFGALIERLKKRGFYDDTLVIFLSDHGEEFREHGVFGHGWDLYREVVEVPMIVKPAKYSGSVRVREVVQLTDVVPTVLAATGGEAPEWVEGVNLLRSPEPARHAFSYMDYEGREGIAVTRGDWKLIVPLSEGFVRAEELFDLVSDPGEETNLAYEYHVRAGYMRALAQRRLSERSDQRDSEAAVELDDETRKALEALGYLE